jgi:DNA polymerase III delta subunit
VELVGDDLTHLRGELEKAALAGGAENRRIGTAQVRAVVGETRARHVFELTRALVDRDRGAALTLMGSLLGAGEEPFALLGMLSREARAIWRAADGLCAGVPEAEVARGLGRPPAAAAAMIGRVRGLHPARAAALLERCWEAERRLKQGGVTRPELSLLIADLCAG